MTDFIEIIGHRTPIQIVKNIIRFDRIGHSYLFTGKEGIGKRLVAIAFSKAINCTHLSQELDPCNHCSSCLKIEKGISPDFHVISPVDDTIKIVQIRELKKNIYFKPLENRKKIYLINDAEKMTVEASNSLLKILEEPPDFAVLILITSFPDAILPTILSRCCRISFKPLSMEHQKIILTKNLPSLQKDQLENLIRLSYGSPGKALSDMGNQDKIAVRDQYINVMVKTKPEKLIDFLFNPEKVLPDIMNSFQDFVELIILWFHDVFFIQIGMDKNQLFFQEQINTIQEYAQYYSRKRIMLILEYLANIPEEMEKHINTNTLLENIFIQLGEK